MSGNDRKSSEDLIREANQRLRNAAADTEPAVDTEPLVDSEPLVDTPSSVADETTRHKPEAPPVVPQPIEYRSDHEAPEETTLHGPLETPTPRRTGISGRFARLIVSGLILGGWFLFTTLADADRGDSGSIVEAGDLDVMSLQVGDCFDDADNLDEVVFEVAAVPCTGAHDNEVFSLQSLGASFGDTYPGEDALSEYTYGVCSGTTFDSYVGSSYVDSSLEVFTFTPTQDSWDDGDREFVCALYRLDFGKLTGTARGSGL
jgi:hypothetical protein